MKLYQYNQIGYNYDRFSFYYNLFLLGNTIHLLKSIVQRSSTYIHNNGALSPDIFTTLVTFRSRVHTLSCNRIYYDVIYVEHWTTAMMLEIKLKIEVSAFYNRYILKLVRVEFIMTLGINWGYHSNPKLCMWDKSRYMTVSETQRH